MAHQICVILQFLTFLGLGGLNDMCKNYNFFFFFFWKTGRNIKGDKNTFYTYMRTRRTVAGTEHRTRKPCDHESDALPLLLMALKLLQHIMLRHITANFATIFRYTDQIIFSTKKWPQPIYKFQQYNGQLHL